MKDTKQIRKDLFEIFEKNKDKYELYESLVIYTKKEINEQIKEDNEEFYNVVVNLLNSINNAGWESRHSKQIDYLQKLQHEILLKIESN